MNGTVFGSAEDAVVVFDAFHDALDENALAGLKHIDCAPLKEPYVFDLMAGYKVAAVV